MRGFAGISFLLLVVIVALVPRRVLSAPAATCQCRNGSSSHVGLILLPGAYIKPSQYQILRRLVSNRTDFIVVFHRMIETLSAISDALARNGLSLCFAIGQFDFDLPNPIQASKVIQVALEQIKLQSNGTVSEVNTFLSGS
jgi:hypothetical protein